VRNALLLTLALLAAPLARAECTATPRDALGPYHVPGAPQVDALAEPGEAGERLVISGRVLSAKDCRPLAGAILDLWQADAHGRYYNLDERPDSDADWRLRGQVVSDGEGRYRFQTVLPGRYRTGFGYRPRHIHVIVRAPGHRPLTTQLYFRGDPTLTERGEGHPLAIPLARHHGPPERLEGHFDFVLSPP
jgi:catechol 1,2-dioxygenase